MLYFLAKVFTSAIVIATVSEISKRSSLWAATLASLPLVSLLSIVWIYLDTRDLDQIASLSNDIFWLVLPSLLFFIVLPLLIQEGLSFWPSLAISCLATIAGYTLTLRIIG